MYKRRIVDKMSQINIKDVIQTSIDMVLATQKENPEQMRKDLKELEISDEKIEELISKSQQPAASKVKEVETEVQQDAAAEVKEVETEVKQDAAAEVKEVETEVKQDAEVEVNPDVKAAEEAVAAAEEALKTTPTDETLKTKLADAQAKLTELKSKDGGRRRTKRKGRKGRKSRKGAKKGAKKSKKSSQSQNGGRRRSSKNRRKHSHRRKH
jgi:hypothetical protein